MSTHKHSQSEVISEALTRRNFLQLGLGVLSGLAVLELGGASLMFLRSRSLEGEFGSIIKAGNIEDFPPGSVTEYPDGNFYLVRADDGGFMALYRRCPHLGCTVNWVEDKQRFYCPCHASSFDAYGNFENQPVPRALDTFPVSFKDELVLVDTTKMVKRERNESAALAYSK